MIPAIIAGIGAAGSIASSLIGANKQADAVKAAQQQNMNLLNSYSATLAPRIAGMEGDYQGFLKSAGKDWSVDQNPYFQSVGEFNPGVFNGNVNLEDDPGYQARMGMNEKALNTRDAVAGSLRSGQGAQEFGRNMQDYASQEYQNAYNRALNTYQTQLGAQNQMFGQANQMYNNQWNQTQANMQQQLGLAGLSGNMLGQQYGLQGEALSAAMGQNTAAAQGTANAWGGMGQSLSNLGGDIFKGSMGYMTAKAGKSAKAD